MDNFEDILCKIDIFRKLSGPNFEKNVWIHIVSNKFISYLPQLLKLQHVIFCFYVRLYFLIYGTTISCV